MTFFVQKSFFLLETGVFLIPRIFPVKMSFSIKQVGWNLENTSQSRYYGIVTQKRDQSVSRIRDSCNFLQFNPKISEMAKKRILKSLWLNPTNIKKYIFRLLCKFHVGAILQGMERQSTGSFCCRFPTRITSKPTFNNKIIKTL